jgi:dihydrofolate reductase
MCHGQSMRTITVVENLSLDGVMQSPSGPEEDPSNGFTAGGWAAPLAADPAQAVFGGGDRTSAMLFGRRTYDQLVGFWLSTPAPNPFTDVLRTTRKYVATHRTDALPHPNSIRLEGRALDAIRALTAEGEGEIVVLGSGDLVRQLLVEGLVDELVLAVVPVVVGSGTRLFGGTPLTLDVVRHEAFPSGITVTRWAIRR